MAPPGKPKRKIGCDLKDRRRIGIGASRSPIMPSSRLPRAYLFAQGYRPSHGEAHKNTFAFMKFFMGKEYEDLISYFDRMRNKRNQAIYDVAGLITETEARDLFVKATEFVKLVRRSLAEKNKK